MYFRKIPNQGNQKFKGKKTIVCQNGGANLLHIDKIVNLTNRKTAGMISFSLLTFAGYQNAVIFISGLVLMGIN